MRAYVYTRVNVSGKGKPTSRTETGAYWDIDYRASTAWYSEPTWYYHRTGSQ